MVLYRAARGGTISAHRRRSLFWSLTFPRDGIGKGSHSFTTGWEWDENVGTHWLDGMGRGYANNWLDGAGRDRGTRQQIGEWVKSIVGKSVGNADEQDVEMLGLVLVGPLKQTRWHHPPSQLP